MSAVRILRHSPHVWGSLHPEERVRGDARVFPTRVGVCPRRRRPKVGRAGLPHTRGGLSAKVLGEGVDLQ